MRRLELLIPPPLLALIIGLIVWVLSALFSALTPAWLQSTTAGTIIGLTGVLISLAGIVTFGRAGTTTDPRHPGNASMLVSSGIYRYSRNPMYLGVLLILIGWAIYLGNVLSVLAALAFIPYMTCYQIIPEERLLQEKFPTEFTAYRRKVRRWL